MRHGFKTDRAQYGELLGPGFCQGERWRVGHQAQGSRLRRDPGFEVGDKFGFLLQSGCGILQISADEQRKIVARWRIGWKSIYELIEWRELIRMLHVCAIVEGDRLKDGGQNAQRT